MLHIQQTSQFRKDLRLAQRRGLDLSRLDDAVRLLQATQALPSEYVDHELAGPYGGVRECHLKPDWLLIDERNDAFLVLYRTGTHSDLF